MKAEPLAIPEVVLIETRTFADDRGSFSETWNRRAFRDAGIDAEFVQDNHAKSASAGTVRGLHYQVPPHAQGKLVRVVRGAIFDVAVDIRKDSPTYGQWVGATLSAENTHQLWVPAGFAHGYATLEDDTEVIYKVTDFYAPECEGGVLWNDPDLAIDWPVDTASALLSEKDLKLPGFRDFVSPF
jgi:dTDP-4-dehydrorhamnose 3,5-epimerase